jgi:hypothetical protein
VLALVYLASSPIGKGDKLEAKRSLLGSIKSLLQFYKSSSNKSLIVIWYIAIESIAIESISA